MCDWTVEESMIPAESVKQELLQEIDKLPDYQLQEVLSFVQHLQEKIEISILGESSLAKDWLTPEEDEAWQDL
jgi:hypothetical protein